MTDLTENDKRRLTEYLDEPYHYLTPDYNDECNGYWSDCSCGARVLSSDTYHKGLNRPFDTDDWKSLGDLKKKIVSEGEWLEFFPFTLVQFTMKHNINPGEYVNWLLTPATFFRRVCRWLKGREEK